MLRCATCGHLKDLHEHHRRGTDCAECDCVRFVHPLLGWVRHLIDRAAERIRPHTPREIP